MNFFLFLLVNATLFIRPAEFTPALMGLPIYEGLILGCLALSYPKVIERLSIRSLLDQPINVCVLGLLVALVLSNLVNGRLEGAIESGIEFTKILLYYLLLISLIDSTDRLRRFLAALALFATAITTLAVLQYHDMGVNLPDLEFVETESMDPSGNVVILKRLGSTGLFMDPNDMCMMLVTAMVICVYEIIEHRRWIWAGPLVLFGHALTLTHSRGGFLAMLVALLALLAARFGRKAVPLLALVLPPLFIVFAGRQTNLEVSGGTGQSRIQLWDEGMQLLIRHPLLGIGPDQYASYAGHVAHNSFINTFTELGYLGGTLFLGMFYLGFRELHRLGAPDVHFIDPEPARLRPYVTALLAGHAGGMLSLSYAFTIPVYLVIGVVATHVRLAVEETDPPLEPSRLDFGLVQRLALVGAGFLVVAFVGIRTLVHY